MKQEIENIDRIFIEGIDSLYSDVSVNTGWKKMRARLILREVFSPKLIKLYVVAIIFFMLFVPITNYFIKPLFTTTEYNKSNIIHNQSTLPALTDHDEATSINTVEKRGPETILPDTEPKLISQRDIQRLGHKEVIQNNAYDNFQLLFGDIERKAKPENNIKHLENKSISGDTLFGENFKSGVASIYNHNEEPNPEAKVLRDKSTLFLGVSFGADLLFDQSAKLKQPSSLFFGGLSIKYETKKFYLKSSINLSYYESVNKYQYYFDTLVGQLVSSGFEIVPIINDLGDTTWSKIYNDALTDVFDTVISDDQIKMTSYKTVLSIPVSIGKNIFSYKRFNASVFGGATLNVLFSRHQSTPKYASNNQEIIQLENNISNEVYSQFYVHGGIMLDYRILYNTNITISTAYNYGLINNSTNLNSSTVSFLNVNFGLLFKL